MKALATVCFATILFCASLFAQQNPVPFVNQPLIPASVAPGGSGFTLTVNGTGFVSGSTVDWNGSARTTTFVSSSQLTAAILSSDVATATTASVTVASPAPGGGTSNVVFLPVREPSTFVSLNQSSVPQPLSLTHVAIDDLNGDGILDIVDSDTSRNEVATYLGTGDGAFTQSFALRNLEAADIAVQDFNGDGRPDLALAIGYGVAILLGNGDGTFRGPNIYSTVATNDSIASADFNGDGKLDLAVATQSGFSIFFGNGDGTFGTEVRYANGCSGSTRTLTLGDFNQDGYLDVALTNPGCGSISVYAGSANGSFVGQSVISLVVFDVVPIITADLNGDGRLDLILPNALGNSVIVLLGKGNGTFAKPRSFATAPFPVSVTAADLNGDGVLDLAVASGGTTTEGSQMSALSTLLGNGDGTFQAFVPKSVGEFTTVGFADFNNDGKLDVIAGDLTLNGFDLFFQDNGTTASLSANKLSFPIQLVDTVSAPKVITLTNEGTSDINVTAINVEPNFSELSNCHSVRPSGSCKIAVYFTPIVQGSFVNYLAITDDAGGSPQTVSLSGVATIVSLNPTSLDFGSVPVHHISKAQNVILTNKGNGPLTINGIGIRGTNAKDFSEVNACPSKLDAGASCTIQVVFHPSVKGTRNAILGILDNGGGSPQEVPLTGTGT